MFSISVQEGDVSNHPCDLLVLKHADDFFGVDLNIAELIGFKQAVPEGKMRVVPGRRTGAKQIAFLGVGPLAAFEYSKIREFGRRAVDVASKIERVKRVCMTIHGPSYGLDEAEAFSSLIAGIVDAGADEGGSRNIEAVEIVERQPARAQRLQGILNRLIGTPNNRAGRIEGTISTALSRLTALKSFGSESETKTRLFVAMPFKDEFNDEWEISIQEAANSLQMLCERIDKSAFTGDISAEIKRRIEQYDGLIALLNGANPNVFLEIGYAWAKEKPTILLAKEGQELPFDVKGQRCLFYKGIADLRTKLKSELAQLQSNGILRRS
jgi:hypothetical protein